MKEYTKPTYQSTDAYAARKTRPSLGLAVLALAAYAGCGNGESGPVTLSGSGEKGPFVQGASVRIQSLDNKGNPEDLLAELGTKNFRGEYDYVFDLPPGKPNIEIIVDGYYFDEYTGERSTGTLSIRALYKTGGPSAIAHVNILTHITKPRAVKHMKGMPPKDLPDAVREAQDEFYMTTRFIYPGGGMPGDITSMNLFEDTPDSQYLSWISCVIETDSQGDPSRVQELTTLLQNDLEDDGMLEPSLQARLDEAQRKADPKRCEDNLEMWLAVNNETGTVADEDKAADTDLDGTSNFDDPDDDGDGEPDVTDTWPLDPTRGSEEWCDTTSKCWVRMPYEAMTLQSAVQTCWDVDLNGQRGYRPPTIDELKTIIDCSSTMTCAITEGSGTADLTQECGDGCGPMPGSYWNPELNGPTDRPYLSMSEVADQPGMLWGADGTTGGILIMSPPSYTWCLRDM